jgi:hypothetical protein
MTYLDGLNCPKIFRTMVDTMYPQKSSTKTKIHNALLGTAAQREKAVAEADPEKQDKQAVTEAKKDIKKVEEPAEVEKVGKAEKAEKERKVEPKVEPKVESEEAGSKYMLASKSAADKIRAEVAERSQLQPDKTPKAEIDKQKVSEATSQPTIPPADAVPATTAKLNGSTDLKKHDFNGGKDEAEQAEMVKSDKPEEATKPQSSQKKVKTKSKKRDTRPKRSSVKKSLAGATAIVLVALVGAGALFTSSQISSPESGSMDIRRQASEFLAPRMFVQENDLVESAWDLIFSAQSVAEDTSVTYIAGEVEVELAEQTALATSGAQVAGVSDCIVELGCQGPESATVQIAQVGQMPDSMRNGRLQIMDQTEPEPREELKPVSVMYGKNLASNEYLAVYDDLLGIVSDYFVVDQMSIESQGSDRQIVQFGLRVRNTQDETVQAILHQELPLFTFQAVNDTQQIAAVQLTNYQVLGYFADNPGVEIDLTLLPMPAEIVDEPEEQIEPGGRPTTSF